ncbi:hypothetical protein RRG08_058268 [Elysia crispata]|uniref:Uncharacterized protein n=1 Tax=Elysia crispata TaxID=231223 RepID=A0AAE0YV91_9GAST|nr:hypothetical protein RRG08_058268 [Elysia crispata]
MPSSLLEPARSSLDKFHIISEPSKRISGAKMGPIHRMVMTTQIFFWLHRTNLVTVSWTIVEDIRGKNRVGHGGTVMASQASGQPLGQQRDYTRWTNQLVTQYAKRNNILDSRKYTRWTNQLVTQYAKRNNILDSRKYTRWTNQLVTQSAECHNFLDSRKYTRWTNQLVTQPAERNNT